jgi:chemotaxis protein CheC
LFAGVPGEKELVLFLYINFEISQKEIRGYLALLMDLPSLETLRGLVQDFLETVSPKGAGQ